MSTPRPDIRNWLRRARRLVDGIYLVAGANPVTIAFALSGITPADRDRLFKLAGELAGAVDGEDHTKVWRICRWVGRQSGAAPCRTGSVLVPLA